MYVEANERFEGMMNCGIMRTVSRGQAAAAIRRTRFATPTATSSSTDLLTRWMHNGRTTTSSSDQNKDGVVGEDLSTRRTGAGHGLVRDRVLPTFFLSTRQQLFRHTPGNVCAVLGAPMTDGQPHVGTDDGPLLLRQAGLVKDLQSLGWTVNDLGDLEFDKQTSDNGIVKENQDTETTTINDKKINAKNCRRVGAGAKLVRNAVYESLQRNEFPLTLGGDHSVGLGTLAGVLMHAPNTGIIWVDAHADLNTPLTSESGNMHGMPVGMLMRGVTSFANDKDDAENGWHSLPGMEWLKDSPRLDPSQVVYIGLRDVDPEERRVIQKLGIQAYTMHEIDRHGMGHVMEMVFHHLLSKDPHRPLHVSYDIDAVDPVLAPATGTTVRGGLTFREAHYVAEAVALTGNLASADVVEVNPSLSHAQGVTETVELGIQIITSLMGKSII
ncbi:hypothetical protein MPSEU_000074700 [Mayamaea pseudoterrestris]|nr:hypothetical protein MPSEU_000074700 [Mayamaea pseudoterrestris]